MSGPRIEPIDPPAPMNPNNRLLCSLEYRSAMKDQNTDTVNTENTVVQMKKARATPTTAICDFIRNQNTSMFATRTGRPRG